MRALDQENSFLWQLQGSLSTTLGKGQFHTSLLNLPAAQLTVDGVERIHLVVHTAVHTASKTI